MITVMPRFLWHRVLAAMLAGGVLLSSCGTDLRDALTIGVMDAVSGTISDLLRTLFPVADWVAGAVP